MHQVEDNCAKSKRERERERERERGILYRDNYLNQNRYQTSAYFHIEI